MKLTSLQTLQLGIAAHKQGDLQEAERLYRTVLTLKRITSDDDSYVISHTYGYLAALQQQKGNIDYAIENYQNALAIKPDFVDAYNNLGATLQIKGDLEAAIANYRDALKLQPDSLESNYLLGHALRDKGDLNASIACYRKLAEINPNDPDAQNCLGAAYLYKGDIKSAIGCFQEALQISPNLAEAQSNLGNAYSEMGDSESALDCYQRALKIPPDYGNVYNHIGHIFDDIGDTEAAIENYKKAQTLLPRSAVPINNLGNAYRKAGRYEEAYASFNLLSSPKYKSEFEVGSSKPQFWLNSISQALECLYILGRYSELKERLQILADSGDLNLRVAAVSAFFSNQLNFKDPYPFCKEPLNFFHIGNLENYVSNVGDFIDDLTEEATKEHAVWEPKHGVTNHGFQTSPIIFHTGEHCRMLENYVREEIDLYRTRFRLEDCEYMNQWPAEFDLRGWFVRLLQDGYQNSHIHPSGWLSGVIYLDTVETSDDDQGAIELGLHGYDLPILDSNFPRITHRPKPGDIVLFPSSLFHRTIPFVKDTERTVIAFDLHRL